jgi:hypothetical protein
MTGMWPVGEGAELYAATYAVEGIAIREGWKLGTLGIGGDSCGADEIGDIDGEGKPGDGEGE